MSEVKSSSK